MPDDRIQPGIVTATGSRLIDRLRIQADANRAFLERMRAVPPLKKPAVLTGRAFDSVTGFWNYSWSEQTYNDAGLRVTKASGFTGSTTWNPAVAYGDGNLPTTFPQEVTIRRRGVSSSRGVVWEFPWFCGCGTGSSGSGVGIVCCGNVLLPISLLATVVVYPGGIGGFGGNDCDCLDGVVVELRLRTTGLPPGANYVWENTSASICGKTWLIQLTNVDTTCWQLRFDPNNPLECNTTQLSQPSEPPSPIVCNSTAKLCWSCNPFAVWGYWLLRQTSPGSCPCDNSTFEVIVTL